MNRGELMLLRLQAQHLLTPVDSLSVARDLCGLQAQFLRNAVHALRLRTDALSLEGMVKTWTLRGTVHLIPEADLPLYLRHCGGPEAVCKSGWYRWTESRGQANPPQREQEMARLTLQAIAGGVDERESLRLHLRAQGMTPEEESRAFDPWGGIIGELAGVGALAFRVSMADEVHPDETKRYCLLPPFAPTPESEARLELARRYLMHYGPVTLRDAAYFFHWTQKELRALFAQLQAERMAVDGREYWHIPGSVPEQDMPPVILLAGFDPLMMGYRKEDNPFLSAEHLRKIFNLAGIVNPAILLNGQVVGKWKEAKGKVTLTAFSSLRVREKRLVEAAAEQLFTIRKMEWA